MHECETLDLAPRSGLSQAKQAAMEECESVYERGRYSQSINSVEPGWTDSHQRWQNNRSSSIIYLIMETKNYCMMIDIVHAS